VHAAETPGAPAKPPAPAARDIRLDLGAGDSRVEVHVVERAGDVQVAVRTPDARLAGDLREELPALTARLEQSGFRTEAWHPPAAVEGRSHGADIRATAAASESGNQPDRQGSRDGREDPQQPKPRSSAGFRSKEDRDRFARLMGSMT
jgi:hypothetical protein